MRITPKIETNNKKFTKENQEKSEIKNPDFKAAKIDSSPITISVKKVLIGILDLQNRQRPLKKIKENIGNKSFLESSSPQEKQIDLPLKKERPVLYLFAITPIKLPKAVPNKNIIIPKMYCIINNIITSKLR
jgi:hypothetical protein